MERIEGKQQRPFENINMGGVFCPNGCVEEQFTIIFNKNPEYVRDGIIFQIKCSTCGTVISQLLKK